MGAALLVVLVLTFVTLRTADELAPSGTRSALTVWNVPEGVPRADAATRIEEAVRSAGVPLTKVDFRTEGGRTVRVLRDVGTREASAQGGWVPGPPGSLPTRRVVDARLPAASVVGTYVSTSPRPGLSALERVLVSEGFEVSTLPTSTTQLVSWVLVELPVLPIVLLTLLGVAGATAHRAWQNRRADALLFVHGASRSQIVGGHLRRTCGVVAVGGIVILAVTVAVAVTVVGPVSLTLSSSVVAASVALGGLLVGLVHTGVTVTGLRADPRRTLGGARPGPVRSLGTAVLHGTSLVLLITLGASIVGSADRLQAVQAERGAWAAAAAWHTVTLSSGDEELERSLGDFALVAADASESGHLIVAQHPLGPTEGYGPYNGHSMIVNARWLDEQVVHRSDGARVRSTDASPDSLVLLVPEPLVGAVPAMDDEWRAWIADQADFGSVLGTVDAETPLLVVPVLDEPVFDYGTSQGEDRSTSTGRVVAVLPTARPLLSDDWLTSALSQGQVLFSDVPLLERRLHETGLAAQVQRIDRAADLATDRLDRQARLLRDVTVLGALAVAVAVGTAAAYAGSIAERSRRREVLLRVWGASALQRSTPAVVGIVLVAVLALVTARATGPWSTVPAISVASLDVVVVVALLVAANARRSPSDIHRT